MSKDKSEPAFPITEEAVVRAMCGMTMRDYFAAKALPCIYADAMASAAEAGLFQDPDWRIGIALDAFAMADAMLKAREAV